MIKFIIGVVLTLIVAPVFADPAVGQWVTIDDTDNSEKFVVDISVNQDGELQGTIVEVLKEADRKKRCDDCPDEFKGKSILGLQIMWGLKNTSRGVWKKGRILDPITGNVCNSQLTLSEDMAVIKVRGYIGVPIIGRSQFWVKRSL